VGPPYDGSRAIGGNRSGPSSALWKLYTMANVPSLHDLVERRSETLLLEGKRATTDGVAPFKRSLALGGVIGRSDALAAVLREVEIAAPIDIAVLITGATGTGKTQLAEVIHDNGPRRRGPFVAINCSAFPDALFESELFGAMPGAYTGAVRRIDGKIAAAQGGTLFLDEVGELSAVAQSKLLQFLDARTYYPLGGSTPVTADVRIIAATNVHLPHAIEERRFRSDLFFRLQTLSIRMPSLAERREDIVPLAMHFCDRARRTHRLPQVSVSTEGLRAIEAAPWPGNIRELASAIESGAIRAAGDGSPFVEPAHLARELAAGVAFDTHAPMTFEEQTRRFQREVVLRALQTANWKVAATARSLALTRAHVHNLIKKFDIKRQPVSHG
jgi:Nif-specific regulatory protein